MKANQIKRILLAAINNRGRVLIVGKPGLGKTALVKWAVAEVSKRLGININCYFLYGSISDPTDFKGMPCLLNGKPDFVPFGDLDKIFNATQLTIVFLDDLGQGSNAVQAAQMSFLDKLKDNPNVVIIGATNGKSDRANVSGILEPIKSRFDSIINMEFDMDVWINEWAVPQYKAGLFPIELVAFNLFRPELMYSVKASSDLVNGPCPRTVEALGKWMMMDLAPEDQMEVYSGAVGEVYATELLGFLQIYKKLISVNDILMDPNTGTIPKMSEPYTASVLFAISTALARKVTENNFSRILTFAGRMPKEFELALVKDCTRNVPECKKTPEYIVWASQNTDSLT